MCLPFNGGSHAGCFADHLLNFEECHVIQGAFVLDTCLRGDDSQQKLGARPHFTQSADLVFQHGHPVLQGGDFTHFHGGSPCKSWWFEIPASPRFDQNFRRL